MVRQTLKSLRTKIGSKFFPSSVPETRNLIKGVLLVIVSYFLLALTTSFTKKICCRLHPFEVVFLQSAMASLILLPYLFKEGIRGAIPKHIGLHLLRDASGCFAFACTFYAVMSIPVTDAMLLYSANALWIPVILLFFGQKIPFKLLLCLLIGFGGVALILRPAGSLIATGSLFGRASGLFMAVAMLSLRILSQKEPRHRIIFYVCFVSMLLGALSLPFVWLAPTLREFGYIFANSLFMVATQAFLTIAYKLSPATRLSPFSYTVVLSAGLIDWLLWNVLPTSLSVAGAVLVVGAALVSISLKTDRQLT